MRRIAKNRLESSLKRRTDTMTKPVPTRESDALPATMNLWKCGHGRVQDPRQQITTDEWLLAKASE
jgi:hypothetical protein